MRSRALRATSVLRPENGDPEAGSPGPPASRPTRNPGVEELDTILGRPLRVLHIGNIANNAYNNAKIQRRYGIEADVVCHDYFHVMGTPEWEDADFEGEIGDPFFPDWWEVDLRGFRRPPWFAQGRLSTCQRYLLAFRRGDRTRTLLLWRQLRLELWLRCRTTSTARLLGGLMGVAHAWDTPASPPGDERSATGHTWKEWPRGADQYSLDVLRQTMWRARHRTIGRARHAAAFTISLTALTRRKAIAATRGMAVVAAGGSWRTGVLLVLPRKASRVARTPEHHGLVAAARRRAGESSPADTTGTSPDALRAAAQDPLARRFRELFPDRPAISAEDVEGYLPALPRWRSLFAEYDVVQAYSTDPIIPVLCAHERFAAYEHGTLREIPFEESARGRVCALGYRQAPVVFVTNSDVMPSVARLGIDAGRVVRLPHAFDSDRLLDFAAEHSDLRPPDDGPPVLFAPARHDWVDGDPNYSKGNDVLLRALALVDREGLAWRAVLVKWGRDLDDSIALAHELGIADRLEWVPPMRKRELWTRYLASHAVADQFTLPAIGGVAFEAMVLGRRLVTSLDHVQTADFFGEAPPVPDCRTPSETAAAIRAVLSDRDDAGEAGEATRDWFLRYHSTARIVDLQVAAYKRLLLGDRAERHATSKPR